MKSILFYLVMFIVTIILGEIAEANKTAALENFGKLPLAFTENRGLYDSRVKFTSRGNGCTMFFTHEGTTFLLSRMINSSSRNDSYIENQFTNPEIEDKNEHFALKLYFKQV